MRTAPNVLSPIVVSALLGLSGCFSLSRNAPPVQHYVLGESRATEMTVLPAGPPSATIIGVRTSRLADYLATPYIVVRRGANRIEFADFDRWGEDLARGIGHTTASYIAARAPSMRVESAPWAVGIQPDYLIHLNVLHFEGVAPDDPAAVEGEVWMQVEWEILLPGEGAALRQGVTELREATWRVADYVALVGLLDSGLDVLSEDILSSLKTVAVP